MCVCFHSNYSGRQCCGRTSRGHTGGRPNRISPPSFCGACLNFDREKDLCTHELIALHLLGMVFTSFILSYIYIYILYIRHNRVYPGQNATRVPNYLQRETDTADWSTPTFTLLCPKNGGVYPATSTFLQNCTPIFRNVPCDLAGSETLLSAIFSARITFRSHQRTPKPNSSYLATGIASLDGRSAPTKEHQNIISSPICKHTMAYHQNSFQSNSDLIHEFCIWSTALLLLPAGDGSPAKI